MPSIEQQRSIFLFGVFELNRRTGELRKHGLRLNLQTQPLLILGLLIERAGQVVTREDIQARLWPENTYVDFDNAINSAIRKLRDSLGDSPENPRFVETVPRQGYRFIAPVSHQRENGTQAASTEAMAPADQTRARPTPGRRLRLALIVAAGLVVVLVATLIQKGKPSSPAQLHVALLTANTGSELEPAFSPDGTRIAYSWRPSEQTQPAIYVKLNGPGDAVNMTKGLERVFSPAWSPDGRWIAAFQDLGREGVIVLIPASGGRFKEAARVTVAGADADTCLGSDFPFICGIPFFGSVLAWSPDGKHLFTSARTAPGAPLAIVRVSLETGKIEAVTSPSKDGGGDFGPAISPDGRQLAFCRFKSMRTGDLYVAPLSDGNSFSVGDPRRITTLSADIRTPAWTGDSRELVFASDHAGIRQLWRVGAIGGEPVRLAGAGEDAMDVAVSRNGGTLAYSRGHYSGSLWKIPISGGEGGQPVRVTATTARDKYSHFSPDGKRIVFESGRSGNDEIWACDADGGNAVQLTSFGRGISGSPRWSPDGRTIAFDSNVAGSFHIYAISSDGGRPVQLTKNESTDAVPNWSRDGAWIYFNSWRTGRHEVWKIRPDGSSETQVTRDGSGLATESADGRHLYVIRGTEELADLFRTDKDGGHPTKVLSGVRGRLFTVVQKGIYFAGGFPRSKLRYLEFATGAIRTIAPLPGMAHADVSSDEHWALYPQPGLSEANLMVVENFR